MKDLLTFGAVDIDTEGGMALAQQLGVLESDGVPSVRAYWRAGSHESVSVFSGWTVPTATELEAKLLSVLGNPQPGERLLKT